MQSWSEISGTVYGNPVLSDQARMVSNKLITLREAVDPAEEFNLEKHSGQSVAFRIYGRMAGTSEAALAETDPIPFLSLPLFHGTGQVYRRGAALAYTGVREDLDRLDVNEVTIKALREHSARTDNKVIYDEAVAGRSFTYVPLTASTHAWLTDGTVAGTYAANLNLYHLRKLVERAQTVNMPFFDGENYLMAVSVQAKFAILGDTSTLGFTDVARYAPGRAEGILNNEIGSVAQMRIVADNDRLSNVLGTGSVFGEFFVFGAEAIKEIMVYPMHFRANLNLGGDFANQKGLCWQSFYGMKAIWNYTTHAQGSIIHGTSA